MSHQPELQVSSEPPRDQLEPTPFSDPLLDGNWRPYSSDLRVELRVLLSALDRVRSRVRRLLLSVGHWTARPSRIVTDGRTVSIGYSAGQSSTMIKVFCADGGTFTVRVAPPGSALGAPDQPDNGQDEADQIPPRRGSPNMCVPR
jgi:hypothetical protein